jgi:hypothetical protein
MPHIVPVSTFVFFRFIFSATTSFAELHQFFVAFFQDLSMFNIRFGAGAASRCCSGSTKIMRLRLRFHHVTLDTDLQKIHIIWFVGEAMLGHVFLTVLPTLWSPPASMRP